MDDGDLLVEQLPRKRRALRIAIVTETYPPDANDVALSAARLVDGLRRREHDIQLVRPRRHLGECATGSGGLEEFLTHGLPIRHPALRVGLPATRALSRLWSRSRPDVVHVLTQGPLGWSALRAARRLKVPVVSEFHAQFAGPRWLGKPILAYLLKFHERTLWTLVPSEALYAELAGLGFRNVRVVARHRWDLAARQIETLFEIAAGAAPACRAASVGRRRPALQGT